MDLMTVEEIAEQLRVSKMTVYRMVNSGTLPSLKIGNSIRVEREALEKYLAGAVYIPEAES